MPQNEHDHEFRCLYCTGCGETLLIPVYCGNRFCPVCTKSRSSRVRHRLHHLIKSYPKKRHYGLKHLTLTIPNRQSAVVAADEITRAFRRLRQRKLWKSFVAGGAFVLEATGEPGNWHVHIHAIISAKFVPWEHLHALWQEVSSGRGVFIQRIPERAVVNYLLKYITKAQVAPEHVDALGAAFHGRRLFQPFGNWHALKAPDPLPPHKCTKCGCDDWLPDGYVRGFFSGKGRRKRGKSVVSKGFS